MGVRGLNNFIRANAKDAISVKHMSCYGKKKIAIDTNILLYKFCYSYPNDMSSFILCFVYKILTFLSNGILPIFIFDGRPPNEKMKIIKKRQTNKQNISERLSLLYNIPKNQRTEKINETISRLEKQNFKVTVFHKNSLKELLTTIGIKWIVASGEAEEYCAALQKKDYVDYTLTDDTDSFVFGCQKVLRFIKNSNILLQEYNLTIILEILDLTHDQFIDFCILSGCDYIDNIEGMNINKCFLMIKKFKNIEAVLNELKKKHIITKNYNYQRVRDIYNNNIELVDDNIKQLNLLDTFNETKFFEIMFENYNLPIIEIEHFIYKIRISIEQFNQIQIN